MMRTIHGLFIVAITLVPALTAQAGDGHSQKDVGHSQKCDGHCNKGKDCKSGCHHTLCPRCCNDCTFSVSKDKETKNCYGVECKTICIPRVTFPWQLGHGKSGGSKCGKDGKGCPLPANGAKSRTVRVLKKYEYECSVCKYKWSADKYKSDDFKYEGDAGVPEAPPAANVPEPPPVDARMLYRKPVVEQASLVR